MTTRVEKQYCRRVRQGDIISDVEYIEYVDIIDGKIEISKILFPLVIVLSQDCDLTWDFESRNGETNNQDKHLFSVIVAPLYNYEHFIEGKHLSELNLTMRSISSKPSKTENKNLKQNETPRYHYFEFDENYPISSSVLDFKHYFTVNVSRLEKHKETHFVCSISDLFRERVSQRFANYLSRIGLPDSRPIKKESD